MRRSLFGLLTLTVACGDGGGSVHGGNMDGGSNGDADSMASAQSDAEGLTTPTTCIETTTPAAVGDGTPDGENARTLIDFVSGTHNAELTWKDGTKSMVTVTIGDGKRFKVESRDNPDVADEPEHQCIGYTRLAVTVVLTTADGRLNETFTDVTIDRSDYNNPIGARVSLSCSLADPPARGHRCQSTENYVRQEATGEFTGLQAYVGFNGNLFTGFIVEETNHQFDISHMPAARWSVGESMSPREPSGCLVGSSLVPANAECPKGTVCNRIDGNRRCSMPELTIDECAARGVVEFDPGDGSLINNGCAGGREIIGSVNAGFEGALCCGITIR